MSKNIDIIKSFLKGVDKNILILNQVNDTIGSFYLFVIKHLSKLENINLNIENGISNIKQANDLFESKSLNIFTFTSKIKIDEVITTKDKSVIFTDYKNYKKYKLINSSINGYDYILDIKYFIRDILNIHDLDLVKSIIDNPQFMYSETSKYLINNTNYLSDKSIYQLSNFILEIRKSIFDLKTKKNIKGTFLKIKEEAYYKKFNFLTY